MYPMLTHIYQGVPTQVLGNCRVLPGQTIRTAPPAPDPVGVDPELPPLDPPPPP